MEHKREFVFCQFSPSALEQLQAFFFFFFLLLRMYIDYIGMIYDRNHEYGRFQHGSLRGLLTMTGSRNKVKTNIGSQILTA